MDQAKRSTSVTSPCKNSRHNSICGRGGIGRHVGFRFQWATVQVQVLSPVPNRTQRNNASSRPVFLSGKTKTEPGGGWTIAAGGLWVRFFKISLRTHSFLGSECCNMADSVVLSYTNPTHPPFLTDPGTDSRRYAVTSICITGDCYETLSS